MKGVVLIPALVAIVSAYGADSIQEFRLPNGLRVVLREDHERPIVRLELRTALQASEIPAGKEGLGGILHEMLRTAGAGTYSREAFLEYLRNRTLRYRHSMQASSLSWSILSNSQGQDAAFEALALAAIHPRLDATQLTIWRQQFLQSLKQRSPRQQAEEEFLRAIQHPEQAALPTKTSINLIENSDLYALLRRIQRPENSVLIIHGDLNTTQAKQLAMLHMGAWGPESAPPVAAVDEKRLDPPQTTRTWIVQDAGARPEIVVGGCLQPAEPMDSSIRYILSEFVRRELEKAYSEPLIKVDFQIREGGAWMIQARMLENRSVTDGLRTLQDLISRIRSHQVTDAELFAAQQRLEIERSNRGLHPQQGVESLAERALWHSDLQDVANRANSKELQKWLQRMFDPNGFRYRLNGDIRVDGKQLEKLGLAPVSVVD